MKKTPDTRKKIRILLPYFIFIIISIFIIVPMILWKSKTNDTENSLHAKKSQEVTNPETNESEKDDSGTCAEEISPDSINIEDYSINKFVIERVSILNEYLITETNPDTFQIKKYLDELKQLYSIKGLSSYENGMLNLLISEYEKKKQEMDMD